MGVIHFLNVKEGDCSWIEHDSGHNTVIDVCNAQEIVNIFESASGNHNQKNHPVNPIEYLQKFEVKDIFRFILTHPDMDHMDGIESLFNSFNVSNFWDTENTKEMDEQSNWGRYKKEDWDFYQSIRNNKDDKLPVLNLYAGAKGKYYNEDGDGKAGGDGLFILAPTKELVSEANESETFNDCSYVILYKVNNKKIIFAGDSEEKTWNYILENHKDEVEDIDILIAPHHGRKSGGNDEYLDVLNPKLTLFGNADSEDLDYASWNNRGLEHITNNQANCVVMNTNGANGIEVYVTNESYAKKKSQYTFFNNLYQAWYIKTV